MAAMTCSRSVVRSVAATAALRACCTRHNSATSAGVHFNADRSVSTYRNSVGTYAGHQVLVNSKHNRWGVSGTGLLAMLIGIIVLVVMFPSGDSMLSCCVPPGGVVAYLCPTAVLGNLYLRCSGYAHSRAAKEEKKPKLIWEGYKRWHKGEIPPKVGGADGVGRCVPVLLTLYYCALLGPFLM